MITARPACRLCQGPLDRLLDLGELALSTFPTPGSPAGPLAPLDLRLCRTCELVQLAHTVDPELLYRQYWYRSSTNEAMQAELTDVVRRALQVTSVAAGDVVVDVGANDGYLLSRYPTFNRQPTRVAYEPARNLRKICAAHTEVLIPECFPVGNEPTWSMHVKILTSIACFYGADDPHAFVRAVDALLHPDGVWVVQFQDLAQMVDATAFDNICHEHLTYWSLATFGTALAGTDLHVVHAERRAINGGSLRLLVQRRAHPVHPSVEHWLLLERLSVGWQALERFAWRVQGARTQIRSLVTAIDDRGLLLDLYGASTKANTLLQYCDLGPGLIRAAWERSLEKVGRQTATGIPIVSEATGRRDPPAVLLVGIWQFREGILQREAEYLAGGGQLLFPLPAVDLVVGGANG